MKQIAILLILQAIYSLQVESFNYFKKTSSSTRSQPFLRKTIELPRYFPDFFGYTSSNVVNLTSSSSVPTISPTHDPPELTDEPTTSPTLLTISPTSVESAQNILEKESETLRPIFQPTSIENYETTLTTSIAPTLSRKF